MSSLRVMAARGVVWATLQTWGVRVTTVLAFIIISRQLQPAEFGLVALSMSIIGVLTLLGDVGMATYLVRKPDVGRVDTSTAFWTSLALASGIAALLAVIASALAALFSEPGLTPILWALCGGLVLAGLGSVPTTMLKREMAFKTLALRATTATLVGSLVAITLALLGAGAWALVAQSLVRAAIATVTAFGASGWRPSWDWSRSEARTMLGFGSTLLGIDLLIQLRDRGEDFVLATISSASTLGLWSVAGRLVKIIQETGSSVISAVATPTFAKMQGDRKRLHRAFQTSLSATSAVMFPPLVLLSVISPELIPLVLGRQWSETGTVAQILAMTTVFATFTYFDRAIFVAVGRLRPEVVLVVVIVAIHLLLVVLAIPHGLLTLAVVLLVRTIAFIPVRGYVLHRVTGMPPRVYVPALRVLAASSVMGALSWVSIAPIDDDRPIARVVVASLVSAVAYLPLLWLIARPVVTLLLSDARSLRQRSPTPPEPTQDPAGLGATEHTTDLETTRAR